MLIIFNKKLQRKKNAIIGISNVIGIGKGYGKNLCSRIGLSKIGKIRDINRERMKSLVRVVRVECVITNELKMYMKQNIMEQIKRKSYKGLRHVQGLPVNGQNTKNNSKTVKYLKIKYEL